MHRTAARLARLMSALIGVGVLACSSPSPSFPTGGAAPTPSATPQRTLIMVVNVEVTNLATKVAGATNPERTTRVFNAGLTLIDNQGAPRPYLAAELPQLNTDSWRVFPDGRMETTWKLRPGLTWQDGMPLTADDFVFAMRLYQSPGLSVFEPKPQDRIDGIVAVDADTILVRWRSLLLHDGQGLDPLPRHILEQLFGQYEQDPAGQRDLLLAQRFWTTEYVGAGPYRLVSWEPGSYLEGAAFEGHALGRPKIERIVIRLMNDENTTLTALLAGQVHLTMAQAIRFEQAMVLRREWGLDKGEGAGKILFLGTSTTAAVPQFRTEAQKSPPLLDARVRQALFSAVDRQAPVPDAFVQPDAPYFARISDAIARYPYDPRRAEQLMNDAGLRKDRDDLFASDSLGRFQPALWISAGAQREQLLAIVTNSWKSAGIDAQPYVMPAAIERDQEARALYPGILVHGVGLSERASAENTTTEQIGTPANRWSGQNRGGWSNPDYDRLWDAYNNTLDRPEQVRLFTEMMKIRSEDVASIPLHYSLNVTAYLSALRGPDVGVSETTSHWNIYDWELT